MCALSSSLVYLCIGLVRAWASTGLPSLNDPANNTNLADLPTAPLPGDTASWIGENIASLYSVSYKEQHCSLSPARGGSSGQLSLIHHFGFYWQEELHHPVRSHILPLLPSFRFGQHPLFFGDEPCRKSIEWVRGWSCSSFFCYLYCGVLLASSQRDTQLSASFSHGFWGSCWLCFW